MNLKTPQWPVHSQDELQAACNVLASGRTNYWTGEEGRAFEKEYAKAIGTDYAVALMNGTIALEAALYALDVGPGDEVITSCRTFIASASCIVMRGAIPVLADVDPVSQNITVDTIKVRLTKKTKAIIVVHLAGWPADMPAIISFAKEHNLKVIEDCAQAHGASIFERRVGSWGDIAAFSFCQDKIITTGGEGGMITTNDKSLWQKVWSFKDHGKDFTKVFAKNVKPGFRFLHDGFGTNWRMTEVQAAIGRLQLRKLPQWLSIRRRNAEILTTTFRQEQCLRLTIPPAHTEHAYYKYYVFVKPDKLKPAWSRDRIVHILNEKNIACFTGSCSEIYLEKAFKNLNREYATCIHAKKLGETSLMFLVSPTLSVEEMHRTAAGVQDVLHMAVNE